MTRTRSSRLTPIGPRLTRAKHNTAALRNALFKRREQGIIAGAQGGKRRVAPAVRDLQGKMGNLLLGIPAGIPAGQTGGALKTRLFGSTGGGSTGKVLARRR